MCACVYIFLQFQTELRKILVSLIEVAQKLLALNPDAVELFKKANGTTCRCCYTPKTLALKLVFQPSHKFLVN
jgi:hypothetical protein